jgi:hypothetical protein
MQEPTSASRQVVRLVVVNITILLVLLAIAEGLYRMTQGDGERYRRTFPGEREDRGPAWARPDADLGWVFSGTDLHTFTGSERPWSATINREGFRSGFNYLERDAKPGTTRIMMLGDSFLFGPYLNDAETLTAQLQEELGESHEVYSFAVPGWGIDQMFMAYMKYVDLVNPDYVILVYIDDDILRSFEAYRRKERMSKPSYRLVDNRLVLREPEQHGVREWLAEVSLLANRFYEHVYRHRESARLARAIFLEIDRQSSERRDKLIVVRYPADTEILENRRVVTFDFEDLFRDHGILYLDPVEEMRAAGAPAHGSFYLAGNAHPAADGNRFVARFIRSKAAIP